MNAVTAIGVGGPPLVMYQRRLRERADELRAQRPYLNDGLSQLLNWLHECFLRFLVGLVNGFIAGYVSHLTLDAFTPQGLNLIARGI